VASSGGGPLSGLERTNSDARGKCLSAACANPQVQALRFFMNALILSETAANVRIMRHPLAATDVQSMPGFGTECRFSGATTVSAPG